MIDKQKIENLKKMLSSCNIQDINLAGVMIKENILNISDEQLEVFLELYDYAVNNRSMNTRYFNLKEFLGGEVTQIDSSDSYSWNIKEHVDSLSKLFSSSK